MACYSCISVLSIRIESFLFLFCFYAESVLSKKGHLVIIVVRILLSFTFTTELLDFLLFHFLFFILSALEQLKQLLGFSGFELHA